MAEEVLTVTSYEEAITSGGRPYLKLQTSSGRLNLFRSDQIKVVTESGGPFVFDVDRSGKYPNVSAVRVANAQVPPPSAQAPPPAKKQSSASARSFQAKADPEKSRSIERQTALKTATDLYCALLAAGIEKPENATLAQVEVQALADGNESWIHGRPKLKEVT